MSPSLHLDAKERGQHKTKQRPGATYAGPQRTGFVGVATWSLCRHARAARTASVWSGQPLIL